MVERHDNRTSRTSGMNTWRAGCGGSRTSGSEGGPQKPTRREPGRALRSDPYTQHRCWDGWFYLAVVIDVYTRMVVGWAMADHLRAELVVDALDMAIWRRRPAPGAIHHSDHGAQYTSWVFGNRLRQAGLLASLGSVGDCYDALAESFFATLQTELFDRRTWPTRRELGSAVFDYLEGFYNPTRRHSALGYHSPASYEAAWRARQAEPAEPAA